MCEYNTHSYNIVTPLRPVSHIYTDVHIVWIGFNEYIVMT